MLYVDNSVSDLVAGYDLIQQAAQRAAQDYANRQAFAQKMRAEDEARAQQAWAAREARRRPRIVLGGEAAVIIAALAVGAWQGIAPALWTSFYCFGFAALILVGVLVLASGIVAWRWLIGPRPGPPPPLEPLPPPPLLENWRAAMRATPPPGPAPQNDPGEIRLVTSLAALMAGDRFPPYILVGARTLPRDNLDAVVVGQRGIWLFDVRDWAGRVKWRGQRWEHVEVDAQGVEQHRHYSHWPDEQWKRMAREIAFTLNRRAPDVVQREPQIGNVQGGVVFTHDNVELDIGSGYPQIASLSDWLKFYPTQQGLVTIDERTALEIVEALLYRHNEVVSQERGAPAGRRSMRDEAQRLIANAGL